MCVRISVFDRPCSDTYDNTAVSYSLGSGSDYTGTEWLPIHGCAHFWKYIFLYNSSFTSAQATPTGVYCSWMWDGQTERELGEWADITVSHLRSSLTLTHFRSARHKHPSVWAPCRLAAGTWRYSGAGFHCVLLTSVRLHYVFVSEWLWVFVMALFVFVCVFFAEQTSV